MLESPKRIVLEAENMDTTEKKKYLDLNIPMYNATKLGNISVYFKNKKSDSFIFDSRDPKALLCR
mgnify:CR=1 FL=1